MKPYDALTMRMEETLVQFLRADTEMAFTLLQTAAIDSASDREHAESAIDKARVALKTIRRCRASSSVAARWLALHFCKTTVTAGDSVASSGACTSLP